MMLAAAAMTLFGALPASRAASAAASTGSPTRLTSAATATSSSARSFSSAISCTSGSAKFASSGSLARSSTEKPWTLVICVSGSICEAPEQSFMVCRRNTAPTCFLSSAIWAS